MTAQSYYAFGILQQSSGDVIEGDDIYSADEVDALIDAIELTPGPPGNDGPQGPPGPNLVSTSTATNITGLLKGDGTNIAQAVAGTDFIDSFTNSQGITNSEAFGLDATVTGLQATAFGKFAKAATNGTAFGWDTSAGQSATAVGRQANAHTGSAFGLGSKSTGSAATAFGNGSNSSGAHSVAFGWLSNSSGSQSFAVGAQAKATHSGAMALGYGATTTKAYQLMIGGEGKEITEIAFPATASSITMDIPNLSVSGGITVASISSANGFNLTPITKAALLATTPTTAAGMWRITDDANKPVYPDGTNWRYLTDGTIVS